MDLAASMARLSVTQGTFFFYLEQINPALTQSWLGNNFNEIEVRSKQFEGDDSRSIYFSRVEKERALAQSHVWQAPEIQRNNESMYLSQMKPNPYSATEYGLKYVPPPSTVYSQQYPPQYPPQ